MRSCCTNNLKYSSQGESWWMNTSLRSSACRRLVGFHINTKPDRETWCWPLNRYDGRGWTSVPLFRSFTTLSCSRDHGPPRSQLTATISNRNFTLKLEKCQGLRGEKSKTMLYFYSAVTDQLWIGMFQFSNIVCLSAMLCRLMSEYLDTSVFNLISLNFCKCLNYSTMWICTFYSSWYA